MANANPSPASRVSNGENLCDPEDKLCPLAQLKRMQRVLYKATQVEGADLREIAQVACAWERLEERKRVLTMKPKPKDVDVSKPAKAARSRPSGVAPLPDPPAAPSQ